MKVCIATEEVLLFVISLVQAYIPWSHFLLVGPSVFQVGIRSYCFRGGFFAKYLSTIPTCPLFW